MSSTRRRRIPRERSALARFLTDRGYPANSTCTRGGPGELEVEGIRFIVEVLDITPPERAAERITFISHLESTAWWEIRARNGRIDPVMHDVLLDRARSSIGRAMGRPIGTRSPAIADPNARAIEKASELRRDHMKVTKRALADRMGIGESTLRVYINQGNVSWPPE